MFNKYDKDRNGTLDKAELRAVVNDVFEKIKPPNHYKDIKMAKLMTAVDQNNDGVVTRKELFEIFKKVKML